MKTLPYDLDPHTQQVVRNAWHAFDHCHRLLEARYEQVVRLAGEAAVDPQHEPDRVRELIEAYAHEAKCVRYAQEFIGAVLEAGGETPGDNHQSA